MLRTINFLIYHFFEQNFPINAQNFPKRTNYLPGGKQKARDESRALKEKKDQLFQVPFL